MNEEKFKAVMAVLGFFAYLIIQCIIAMHI